MESKVKIKKKKITRRMKIDAILRCKLGELSSVVSKEIGTTDSTLKRWIKEYVRPNAITIIDMLSEQVVYKLSTSLSGPELNATINAAKLVLLYGSENTGIIEELLKLGDASVSDE